MRGVFLIGLLATSTASALPPGADPGLRDGANHRVGDDSFVTAFGRAPTSADPEKLRMKTHLVDIRAKLAAKPATRPELAARRAELLGYLDDYIAKGITPRNEHLPWRTPVFIDDHGNICAVGYLIERSVGRALPETIAREHRYDFLEDIAAAMPEVRAWVDRSGFTLAELASIQPGYAEPEVESWDNVNYVAFKLPDGKYEDVIAGGETRGALKKGHMDGVWTRTIDGKLVGKGRLSRGTGTWTSFYPDGKKLARGPYVGDRPHGAWTLYHPSGNVAAVGAFRRGHRSGAWKFFYDTRSQTPIAIGRFSSSGSLTGSWRHYDAGGKLLASSRDAGSGTDPTSRGATLMTIVPGKDGVAHEVHAFGGMDSRQLHMVAKNGERLYVENYGSIYDAHGNLLQRDGEGWTAAACDWSSKRKAIAKSGDVSTLHRLLRSDYNPVGSPCGDKQPVTKARAAAINKTLGSLAAIRAPSPKFVRELALGNVSVVYTDLDFAMAGKSIEDETAAETEARTDAHHEDLVRVLAASLAGTPSGRTSMAGSSRCSRRSPVTRPRTRSGRRPSAAIRRVRTDRRDGGDRSERAAPSRSRRAGSNCR